MSKGASLAPQEIKIDFWLSCRLASLYFLILPHGEVLGAAAFQPVKHIVHRVFEGLRHPPGLPWLFIISTSVFMLLFFLRPLITRCKPIKGAVQKGFGFGPELVALLAVAFGVGDQGGNKFQNIAFCLDIGQR